MQNNIDDSCRAESKKQIKKGIAGSRKIIENYKKGSSIALMIDQRVREGIKVPFFERFASTTTIPAQLFKKYGCEVVPIYIERKNQHYFKITVSKPIKFNKNEDRYTITLSLNENAGFACSGFFMKNIASSPSLARIKVASIPVRLRFVFIR